MVRVPPLVRLMIRLWKPLRLRKRLERADPPLLRDRNCPRCAAEAEV